MLCFFAISAAVLRNKADIFHMCIEAGLCYLIKSYMSFDTP